MAEEGVVVSCHSVDAWTEQLQRGIDNKKLIVVDFTASWCGPCRMISPMLTEWARRFPQVTFLKVDVDELGSVASDWAIEAMPTFMFLKEGNIVDKVVGARKEELLQKIMMHVAKISAQ
ncbi:Thioredoxin H-type 2 [Nymphaea thermarum]|nr:Thioredoxin H-type 2 [Nymphaea thermarum]